METKETTVDFLKNLKGEFHIVRAGLLANIRIYDIRIKTMEETPDYFKDHQTGMDSILESRLEAVRIIERITRDIDLLQDEIFREKQFPKNISMTDRLFKLLGHI